MANRLIELPLQFENPASAFTIFQGDYGTSPVADSANDTLTLTSSDTLVTITGDSSTDTMDFALNLSALGSSLPDYITGPLRLGWGSAAAPAYSFNSAESDMGMYLFDSSRLAWTINGGLDNMFLSANGLGIGTQLPGTRLHTYKLTNSGSQILAESGDSTEASLWFKNTATSFSTGVNSSGNFIIANYPGSIAVGAKLTLTTGGNLTLTGTITGTSLTGTGLTAGSVLIAGSGGLVSQDNTKLFWDNTNKRLAINTSTFTSTTARLEVYGADDLDTSDIIVAYANNLTQGFAIRYNGLYAVGTNTTVHIALYPKGGGDVLSTGGFVSGSTSFSYLGGLRIGGFDTANTIYASASPIAITNNGGVQGISVGYASPYFTIFNAGGTDGALKFNEYVRDTTAMAAGVGGGVAFAGEYGSGPATFSGIRGVKKNGTSTDFAGELCFYTRINGGSLSERMRIDDTGLVGLGTSTPTTYLDINGNKFRVRTAKTPSSATDTGDAGDICWDSSYIYVCVATNTWERTAIATW
jgi:hypothetical protein